MSKKFLALLLCFLLLIPSVAFAKVPDISRLTKAEKLELLDILLQEIDDDDLTIALNDRISTYFDTSFYSLYNLMIIEAEARGIKAYQTLENGSRGEDVQALQQRLIDLNYLTGKADGSFGNKPGAAVEAFQREVNLPETGIADPFTQIYLFMDNAPDQKETEPTTPPKKQSTTSSNGIRPEVKEALDSYEEFFDEYCDFIEKYEKSNYPVSMLMDYLAFMQSYAETMNKLEKMEDDLNDAELTYYIQVTGRITKRLAELSY